MRPSRPLDCLGVGLVRSWGLEFAVVSNTGSVVHPQRGEGDVCPPSHSPVSCLGSVSGVVGVGVWGCCLRFRAIRTTA